MDAILADEVEKQEAREKAGRRETARTATRRLQELMRGETVGTTGAEPFEGQEKLHSTPELIAAEVQARAAAEVRKAQAEIAMMRGLQAVSERAVTEAAQMKLEPLARAKAPEVAELHETQ